MLLCARQICRAQIWYSRLKISIVLNSLFSNSSCLLNTYLSSVQLGYQWISSSRHTTQTQMLIQARLIEINNLCFKIVQGWKSECGRACRLVRAIRAMPRTVISRLCKLARMILQSFLPVGVLSVVTNFVLLLFAGDLSEWSRPLQGSSLKHASELRFTTPCIIGLKPTLDILATICATI